VESEHVERQEEREHEIKAGLDELEQQGDQLEERREELEQDADELREDWDRKAGSAEAPGAQPRPEEDE
jgi:hypothetical protein